MGSNWEIEHKKEHYYNLAKKQDYRSRSAFKLKQLNKRYNLIKKESIVIDLGAAPGGWSQVALEIIGDRGQVISVDLQRIRPFEGENFDIIRGDFTDFDVQDRIMSMTEGKIDVILCDASPKLTGIKDMDNLRAYDISVAVLDIANNLLRYKGALLIKAFQGQNYSKLLKDIKNNFRVVRTTKPDSSRKKSAEMYIIARQFKG
ncbi:MAG: RlmE family RNA methyltransferase [Methanobacteriaceae archaeon]|nr:RlmE family RNA methyltransferase [Methanobacteriaceae archaeon]